MDQIKIGKFIASQRKSQALTQRQLADRLHVTDKTISKWETGHRLPDASVLLELSSVLEVDINELLAGEKFLSGEFSSEEYMKKSESNLVGLVNELNEIDKKSRSRRMGMMAGVFLVGLALFYLFASSLRMGRLLDIFDLPTLSYLLGLKFMILSMSGWFYDYLNAWKACILQKDLSDQALRLARQAVKYAKALTWTLGCLISFLGFFSLMNYMEDPHFLWPSLAQGILPLLYTTMENTLYVIFEYRIKRKIRTQHSER